jgi:hypothetical protein
LCCAAHQQLTAKPAKAKKKGEKEGREVLLLFIQNKFDPKDLLRLCRIMIRCILRLYQASLRYLLPKDPEQNFPLQFRRK